MSQALSLFNNNKIETLFDSQNQSWFKRANIGKYLGIVTIRNSFKNFPSRFLCKRSDISDDGSTNVIFDGLNSHDTFVNLDGMIEIAIRSEKPKAATLVRYLVKKGVEKIQESMEKKQKQIENNEMALALLNDDLSDRDRQITILEQNNLELQQQTVPDLTDVKKNNGMVIIQKNNGDEFPYVAICGQQGYVTQKIRNKLTDYPNGQIIVLSETSNAIVHYNWLRERGCIIANPDRVRHFRLGINYTQQRLMELQDV